MRRSELTKEYWGETYLTLYLRGKEHWSAYLSKAHNLFYTNMRKSTPILIESVGLRGLIIRSKSPIAALLTVERLKCGKQEIVMC